MVKAVRIAVKTILALLDVAILAAGAYFLRRGLLHTEFFSISVKAELIYGGVLAFLGLCLIVAGVASLQSKFDWLWMRFKATRAEIEQAADRAGAAVSAAPVAVAALAAPQGPAPIQSAEATPTAEKEFQHN